MISTISTISTIYKTLFVAATLGLSTLAQAHVGADLADHHALSLVDGLLHPFTGLDHLAAMLAAAACLLQ
jgi:urease accessory protein